MATIGQYKGQDITKGTDAEVAEQMRRIDGIPAQDIQPTTPVTVPTPTNTSSAQTIDQISAETSAQSKKAEQELASSKKTFEQRISDVVGVMGSRTQLEEEQGLGQARLDTADIRNQIEAREMSLRRAVEATQKTAGLSGTQIARQVQALNRDAARELADLSIIESARLRRMDAIETNIDRKISAQLEPLQFQLQFDQMFYQENKQALTQAQDRAFQLKIAQEERNYQEKQRERDSIKNIALSAAQYGATGEQIKQITDVGSFEEAMTQGATFLGEPFRLQVEMQQFQQWAQKQQISMGWTGIDLQKQQLAEQKISNALAQTQQLRGEGRKEVLASEEYKVAQTVSLYQDTLIADMEKQGVIKSDGSVDWEKVSKNDTLRYNLATTLARVSVPDIGRAVSAEEALQDTSLPQKLRGDLGRIVSGKGITPELLQTAFTTINSRGNSAAERLEFRVNDVASFYGVDTVDLPNVSFNNVITAPQATQVLNTIGGDPQDVSNYSFFNSLSGMFKTLK
jgi:hypothetical protein